MKKQRIEYLNTAVLVPYARNSRTHSTDQIAQIATSIEEFGFTNPVLIDAGNEIIAGHGRVMAAQRLGMTEVPCIRIAYMTEAQKRAYVIADNQLALNAGWDEELLAQELTWLEGEKYDLSLTGFDAGDLEVLLVDHNQAAGSDDDADAVPEIAAREVSRLGDVWQLGEHRVMCGDSTDRAQVERLADGVMCALLHADPPYGMGKQKDGVENDNLYRDKLDAFQMAWWRAFRPSLVDNASGYIWGNAPDLWRLWYRGGLADSEYLELRNEIVWDKKAIPGMASDLLTQYPEASERCLFFQFGHQFIGNINTEDYPKEWDVVRGYMAEQATSAGIKPADIRRLCGCGMYSHWFTRSQYTLIPRKHYETLQDAYPEQFARPWPELKRAWDEVKGSARAIKYGKLDGARSYFDNAHDVMRDVWEYSRVVGEDRHNHATPKPVSMMERVMHASLPMGGVCLEPFGGSGSTLIGAERTRRICYTMEIQPKYCDVIVRRWQNYTGKVAVHADTGERFPAE